MKRKKPPFTREIGKVFTCFRCKHFTPSRKNKCALDIDTYWFMLTTPDRCVEFEQKVRSDIE